MTLKIAAVCDNQLCGEMLKEAGKKLGLTVNYEVQNNNGIINKLSDEIIFSSISVSKINSRPFSSI